MNAFAEDLRRVIERFCCGTGRVLDTATELLYPLVDRVHANLAGDLANLCARAEELGHQTPSPPRPGASATEAATVIAELYAIVAEDFASSEGQGEKALLRVENRFERSRYRGDWPYLKPVVDMCDFLVEEIAPMTRAIVIHGSMASLDYVRGNSDVDTWIVVKGEVFRSAESIARLRAALFRSMRFLYAVDPLQHHGHFLVPEAYLRRYSESILPLRTVASGVLVHPGELELEIRLAPPADPRAALKMWLETFRTAPPPASMSAYDFKRFQQAILLLPALYLQAMGTPTLKRDSFEEARGDFTDEEWAVVERASRVHYRWTIDRGLAANALGAVARFGNPRMRWLAARVTERPPPFAVTMTTPELWSDAAELAEAMLAKAGNGSTP